MAEPKAGNVEVLGYFVSELWHGKPHYSIIPGDFLPRWWNKRERLGIKARPLGPEDMHLPIRELIEKYGGKP